MDALAFDGTGFPPVGAVTTTIFDGLAAVGDLARQAAAARFAFIGGLQLEQPGKKGAFGQN